MKMCQYESGKWCMLKPHTYYTVIQINKINKLTISDAACLLHLNAKWHSQLRKKFGNFYKDCYVRTIWLNNYSLRYLLKKNEMSIQAKFCANFHSSVIHNCPQLETTQMSIYWWMGKQIMTNTWNMNES